MAPHIKPHPTTPTFQPSNQSSTPQKNFFIMDAFTHKKTFFYNFFPTKAEEEAERPGIDKQVGRVVIEIRDLPGYYNPPPPLRPEDPQDLLRIRIKSISANEVKNGMLFVSFTDTIEHLFRHWPLDVVSCVTTGQKQIMVSLADVSDCGQGPPAKVHTVYFQRWYGDEYYVVLGLEAVFRERAVKMGDEIGLAWDNTRKEKPMFVLKLLSRGNRAPMALSLG